MCTVDPAKVTVAPTNPFDTEVNPIIRIEPVAVSRLLSTATEGTSYSQPNLLP